MAALLIVDIYDATLDVRIFEEAHLFETRAEAEDFAVLVEDGLDRGDVPNAKVTVRDVPSCFKPNDLVVVHEPRGF